MIDISQNDLMLRFNQVKDRALHLGWANYTIETGASSKPGYRIINSLAKPKEPSRIPFGETFCTAGEMLHFLNGFAHALHAMEEYKKRSEEDRTGSFYN